MTRFDPDSLDKICRFPKHKDKPWVDVVEEDPEFAEWLISMDGPDLNTELEDYLTELLEENWLK